MKKIFNVIGICALISYLFIFSSCEESYDEDELLRDIERKKNEKKRLEEAQKALIEAQKTSIIVFKGDTFTLPAKVLPVFNNVYTIQGDTGYFHYKFNISDKDTIMKSLYEQTKKISIHRNFNIEHYLFDEELDVFLKNVIVEVPEGASYWHYIKSQNDTVRAIWFNDNSEEPYFIIEKDCYYIDGNDNVEQFIYPPIYVVPNGTSN